jgi:hypothetical protein
MPFDYIVITRPFRQIAVSGRNNPTGSASRQDRGFALVVTLSLMVLLAVVAVGLLSLSAVSLRASGQGAAQAEARANARLALMLAIGELQQLLGPDRNITAPSSIFDEKPETPDLDGLNHRHLTGVWQARGESLEQTPDYSRDPSFRRWLVSNAEDTQLKSSGFARQGTLSDPVLVVGDPAGPVDDQVNAGRVRVKGGALAWWVGDENCKAFINPSDLADRAANQNVADLLASAATPGAHGIRALTGFNDFPSNTQTSDKLLTIGTLPLTGDGASQQPMFHHLSPHPQSVLANVTNGSLRKDLSLFLERTNINWLEGWGKQEGKSRAPAGPLGPNNNIALSNPRDYDVMPWKYLHHWYHMHRQQVRNANNFPLAAMKNYTPSIDPIHNPAWNSGVTRVTPLLVRLQLILSYGLKRQGNADRNGNATYDLYMYSFPVVTLWNPYSVGMDVEEWSTFLHTLPLEHTIYKNNVKHTITAGGSTTGAYNWGWPHGQHDHEGGRCHRSEPQPGTGRSQSPHLHHFPKRGLPRPRHERRPRAPVAARPRRTTAPPRDHHRFGQRPHHHRHRSSEMGYQRHLLRRPEFPNHLRFPL